MKVDWYERNHCTIRRGSKKSHAESWFGAVSYRRMKLINGEDIGTKHRCLICNSGLVRVRYLGVFLSYRFLDAVKQCACLAMMENHFAEL